MNATLLALNEAIKNRLEHEQNAAELSRLRAEARRLERELDDVRASSATAVTAASPANGFASAGAENAAGTNVVADGARREELVDAILGSSSSTAAPVAAGVDRSVRDALADAILGSSTTPSASASPGAASRDSLIDSIFNTSSTSSGTSAASGNPTRDTLVDSILNARERTSEASYSVNAWVAAKLEALGVTRGAVEEALYQGVVHKYDDVAKEVDLTSPSEIEGLMTTLNQFLRGDTSTQRAEAGLNTLETFTASNAAPGLGFANLGIRAARTAASESMHHLDLAFEAFTGTGSPSSLDRDTDPSLVVRAMFIEFVPKLKGMVRRYEAMDRAITILRQ
jgi:hypothetical protein